MKKISPNRISRKPKRKAARKTRTALGSSKESMKGIKDHLKAEKGNAKKKKVKANVKIDLKAKEKKEKKPGSPPVKNKEEKRHKKAIKKPSLKGGGKVERTRKKVLPQQKKGTVKKRGKVFPEAGEKKSVPWEALPAEYGENGITLMVVDPYKLFVFWEVREDTAKMLRGELNIRIYDATGGDLRGTGAIKYYDIAVGERAGKLYIDALPAKEFIADVGIAREGIFVTVARSHKVATPHTVFPAGGAPQKLDAEKLRVGY